MALAANQSAEATLRSARAAEDSVRELRENREQESAPYVVAYFDASFETSLIYLVIKNVAKTPANSVRFLFDPPIQNSLQGIDIAVQPSHFGKDAFRLRARVGGEIHELG
jgi:hypothetical protein